MKFLYFKKLFFCQRKTNFIHLIFQTNKYFLTSNFFVIYLSGVKREKKNELTAVRRFTGRVIDELRDDLTAGNGFRVGLSPPISLKLLFPPLEYNFRFLNAFNLSCFFCISSICALKNQTKRKID